MKRNERRHGDEEHEREILKAVAQAWHAHFINSKHVTTISESEAHRCFFKGRPTRFKLEANRARPPDQCSWDFKQSLWDSYEIVSVSKKLETDLLTDDPFSTLNGSSRRRRRESSNSLRSLFNRTSSRRFSEDDEFLSQQD